MNAEQLDALYDTFLEKRDKKLFDYNGINDSEFKEMTDLLKTICENGCIGTDDLISFAIELGEMHQRWFSLEMRRKAYKEKKKCNAKFYSMAL